MRSFQSKLSAIRPPYLPAEHFNYLQTLHWENEHTARIRRAIGDDKLCMAFSPKAKCWAIARKIRVYVKFGLLEPVPMDTPMIWMFWVGPNNEALEPDDARLETTIRFGDTWKRGASTIMDDVEASEKVVNDAIDRAAAGATDDLVKELQPALARAASDLGIVRHRDTGNDAKKVTSAGIWRGN